MESHHLNKPVYKSKRKKKCVVKVTVNTRNSKMTNMKMLKIGLHNHKMWRRKLRKPRLFFLICLNLYDYQAQASRYRKGLTCLKKGQPEIKTKKNTFTKTEETNIK